MNLMPRKISIRWKLIALFAGLVAVVMAAILVSISTVVDNRIRQEINENFVEAGRIFERIQEIRFRQLRQSGILLSETPQLKAALSTGDTSTVNHLLQNELRFLLDFDPIIPDSLIPDSFYEIPDSAGLLIVTDHIGQAIGQMNTGPLPGFSIAERPGITEALSGLLPERSYIWKENNTYFNVITVPVFLQTRLLGTLSYGFPMRQIETEQLSLDIGMSILYFVENDILTGSFIEPFQMKLDSFSHEIHSATFDVINLGEAVTRKTTLSGQDWLIYVAPMQQGNRLSISGYYAVIKSLTNELATVNRIQFLIFIFGFIGIGCSIVASYWITSRITRPISLLVDAVERLENEDFDHEVPITTNDELSTLTIAFNKLSKGIRERLMMLKFVSKATLDAIKKDISKIEPGGERRDVAVFFSDIRGFTSWSESRTPEMVIVMLNELFSFQNSIIQKYGGDIDKFVGDELIAVFQDRDKEQRAVEAAMEIQLNSKKILENHEDIAVGIGINSGEVVMGAMGSNERMDYTVLGSEVNLGSRLCSSAKGGQILVSKSVFLNLERKITTKTQEKIKMKGFDNAVTVYEVIWNKTETNP